MLYVDTKLRVGRKTDQSVFIMNISAHHACGCLVQDSPSFLQADRDSSFFCCRSNEYTAELMGTPTSFPLRKFIIVTSDFEEICYIVKREEKFRNGRGTYIWSQGKSYVDVGRLKGVLGAYIKTMEDMYNRAQTRVRKVGDMWLKDEFPSFYGISCQMEPLNWGECFLFSLRFDDACLVVVE
ncbi:hypothetical protein H5410_019970 [Solanum commersonii]|uniref:Uncharacterized protein n=1 Tax=Solanum commersonii TaxID=4109 RepID=A0A9J5Z736_SOLCO|nr:hypothetical protein H5410_019970 [Solanum commersonii]